MLRLARQDHARQRGLFATGFERGGEISASTVNLPGTYIGRREAAHDPARAPPNLDDVGAFPFKFDCPAENEYPKKLPKPYMELYDNRWWFIAIFARTHLVGRFVQQLWPNLLTLPPIRPFTHRPP